MFLFTLLFVIFIASSLTLSFSVLQIFVLCVRIGGNKSSYPSKGTLRVVTAVNPLHDANSWRAMNDSDRSSSPDSNQNLKLYRTNFLTDFHIKKGKIYGKDFGGKIIRVTSLSHLGVSATDDNSLTGSLSDSTSKRSKSAECAREWTEFFLNNDIILVGAFTCANKLKDGSSSNSIEVNADRLFLYYSLTPRNIHGKDKGVMSHGIRRVHLGDTKKTVDLDPCCLYALGDSSCEHPPIVRSCLLCIQYHSRHIIHDSFTPCPKFYRFVTTDASLLKMTEFASDHGAAILHVPTNRDPELRTCIYREFLCDDCKTRAILEGNQWFRMTGDCPQEKDICPNHEACECVDDEEENEEHVDYFFIPECSVNNLPNNPVADGLSSGRLKFIWGVGPLAAFGYDAAQDVKYKAMEGMKAGEPVTIPQLMEECCVRTVDEFLGIIMSDKRLADFITTNKSFTLSKVNGFIENPEMHKVGPWLDGRLVTDSEKLVWHVPHMRKVVIETREEVSSVREARSGDKESDVLGSFIK